jgi:polyphosphate kinase 2 (PPK2 family)
MKILDEALEAVTLERPHVSKGLVAPGFQAMDAAGKDSTIKHVMSGINPQCQVFSIAAAPEGFVKIDQ